MKKIGIMGGTFNPIHYGHLLIAETAVQQFQLDQILFMPNHHPEYRTIDGNVSDEQRSQMIQLAIHNNDRFQFSDLELLRDGATYTSDTLTQLTEQMPDTNLFFILGADSLFQIESWHEPETIMKLCHIIAAPRSAQISEDMTKQIKYLSHKYKANISYLHSPNVEISSKDIRKRVATNNSIRYLLPEMVREYIIKNNLYME